MGFLDKARQFAGQPKEQVTGAVARTADRPVDKARTAAAAPGRHAGPAKPVDPAQTVAARRGKHAL